MKTLEDLKRIWEENKNLMEDLPKEDPATLRKIISKRVGKQIQNSMKFFWASFTLQLIVYALLSHVIIKYGSEETILYLAVCGIILYLPYSVALMQKFKKLAITKPLKGEDEVASLFDYVQGKRSILGSFYSFKRGYEFFLIPLISLIGVILTFEIYVPGGTMANLSGATITYIITVCACIVAIRSENIKSFKIPIQQLDSLLEEFKR